MTGPKVIGFPPGVVVVIAKVETSVGIVTKVVFVTTVVATSF